MSDNICCDCKKEITGVKKVKLWYGRMLPICYGCWLKYMELK